MNILLVESSFSSLNPSLSRDLTNSAVSLIRLVTSATFRIPPSLRTLWASLKKLTRLVPISERQKTATSTLAGLKGTFAISHAVTNLFLATRSNECTLFATLWAIAASPQPKSATTLDIGLQIDNTDE